jgi:indolepyruvate ferredoxin oxidoreductase alpha subunit
MHSSQNEQDNRNYASAAKVPMLEPSDSQEAKDFTRLGFELSEQYDTPVILRLTTRISHSKGIVNPSPNPDRNRPVPGFKRNIKKYVMIPSYARLRHMIPSYARLRHVEVEHRMRRIEKAVNDLDINRVEMRNSELGIITSGISYQYVKEGYPEASILKLGVVYPLPQAIIRDFCKNVEEVYVIEELDPFLELRINAMGIPVRGKKYFPLTGELNPDLVRRPLAQNGHTSAKPSGEGIDTGMELPPRPPSLCPGCPHTTVFKTLQKLGLTVTGDIGCYTLGALPPFASMDTCVDMGASITIAQGIELAQGNDDAGGNRKRKNTVAVLGDSTFAHSGLPGLLNAAYNKRNSLIIVLDNGTTAMTLCEAC